MPNPSNRDVHAQGWDRLFALVKQRNDLLRELDRLISAAAELTWASGMVREVDTNRVRQLLDQLTPQIDVAIEQHNASARQIGKPEVHWQKATLGR